MSPRLCLTRRCSRSRAISPMRSTICSKASWRYVTLQISFMHICLIRPQALDGEIEKQSPSLGREAVYTSTQRLTRLPSYLTVHMVRFAWKRDIGKKAKIMVCTLPASLHSASHHSL